MKISLHLFPMRFSHGVILFSVLFFSCSKTFAQSSSANDSITVAIAPAYDSVNGLHRFWLGEGYRKLWAAPVKMKVFHLDKEKGGLTVLQAGGGLQTKSLRLKDASGKQWTLRSVQKYPERRLPENLRNTVAQKILQDQVVTAHPYAALTVPSLATALGIVHSNPQVVYVPDDPALGQYRNDFANSVLLFEEREPIDTLKTLSTENLQEQAEKNGNGKVDQGMVLRARLLDMLLGDWDRHEDQWRWEGFNVNNQAIYSPVPRDRDYVFYHTSGVLPWIVSHQWLNTRFQGFHESIRDVAGYNFNARYFDRYFLNALNEDDWNKEIAFVQQTLTDDVLRSAVKKMPDTIYALSGEKIVNTLIARRENLKKDAMQYYHFLSGIVDVPASDNPELFEAEHKNNGELLITISKLKINSTKGDVVYQRAFDPAVTKEVRLYGFGGNDIFSVSGYAYSPIKLRMIGGDGVDNFQVRDDNPNRSRLVIYDRSDEQNVYATQNNALLRTSSDSSVNSFDKRNFRFDRSTPLITLLYNPDQGSVLSAGWLFLKNGFHKEPYASRNVVLAGYSASRESFSINYNGDFRKAVGNFDLNLNFVSRGPHNVSNFFGTGNDTKFTNDILYYRNRFDVVDADVRLKQYIAKHSWWSAGLAGQYYASFQTNNQFKFLNAYNGISPSEKVFSNRVHAGVSAGITVDTRQDLLLPDNGIFFNTDAKVLTQLRDEKKSFGSLETDFSVYTRLSKDSGIVLLNRIGGGTTVGQPAFYQMMQLGGAQMLRGFNHNRFTGRSMLYHNAELRLKLFRFTSYLFPGVFGLIGFNDVGRVWMPNESSTTWHDGYGGGIYIVPANVVLIRALVGHSVEHITQVYFNLVFGL